LVIALWPSHGGQYPAYAYKAAFALNLAAQVAALIYFFGREAWAAALAHRAGSPSDRNVFEKSRLSRSALGVQTFR
jgi:hypothetical protein